jgi:hypothetical protein
MLVACVACRGAVLGYMENLWRTYIFANFLYLYQLIPYPSSHTPLLSTEATIGDPDEVRTASGELDHLTQGNPEFSIYYAKFQPLMAILDYDSKAKKAALNQGLSIQLQATLIY